MSGSSKIEEMFPRGLLRPELLIGALSSVSARTVRLNLNDAGSASGSHFLGGRYGKGEVGEFVLIEGQVNLLLGRILEIQLPDAARRSVDASRSKVEDLDAIGTIQLLGSVAMDSLHVTAGVDSYPRLGDRVYAAPHRFVAELPALMEPEGGPASGVHLRLGTIDGALESAVSIRPEKLFGRHCAILGSTGGGKSWTTARIIEECLKHRAKLILLDATGEYRGFAGPFVTHLNLASPVVASDGSIPCLLPPTSFNESDFVAMFEPSGKVQGPKFRAAIQSLRLAKLEPALANAEGLIVKVNRDKSGFNTAMARNASRVNDPRQEFDVSLLSQQIVNECVTDYGDPKWKANDAEVGYCASLLTRINGILAAPAFQCVFGKGEMPHLTNRISEFATSNEQLLRIDLSGVVFEHHAREIVANVIGRYLLDLGRSGLFRESPVVAIVDEAHNFLGRQIGGEDAVWRLDAFELIAKEGRKYGLTICLATQRPRDVTEGVLSQMGTLVVHRLTNDRDREVVERACGEIDRSATSFLPNLRPGEAAIIGVDFPIPLTIQICAPEVRPKSDGPDYQKAWQAKPDLP
jgi:hypothetical protein